MLSASFLSVIVAAIISHVIGWHLGRRALRRELAKRDREGITALHALSGASDDPLSLPECAQAFREFVAVTNGGVSEDMDKLLKAAEVAVMPAPPPISNQNKMHALYRVDISACTGIQERLNVVRRWHAKGLIFDAANREWLLRGENESFRAAYGENESFRAAYREIFDEQDKPLEEPK